VLGRIVPRKYNGVVKTTCLAGFVGTFVKYRMLDIGRFIIFNEGFYSTDMEFYPKITFFALFWAFYALNIYWFCLIVKKIYDATLKNTKYDNAATCEWITQYSVGGTLVLSNLIYWRNGILGSVPATLETVGLVSLSISSFIYHRYTLLKIQEVGEAFDMLSGTGGIILFYDTMSISFHSFCSFLACIWHFKQSLRAFVIEASLMAFCCVVFSVKVWKQLTSMRISRMMYNELSDGKSRLFIYIMAPSVLGSVMVAIINTGEYSTEECIVLAAKHLCNYWITWCTICIQPFNRTNHINTHISLAIMHFVLATDISKTVIRNSSS
jgi:hypothetical protein